MKQMAVKLVIFDVDGTLLNVYERYSISYVKAFEKMQVPGVKIDRDKIIGMRKGGMSGLEIIRKIAPNLGETKSIELDRMRKKIMNEDSLLTIDHLILGTKNTLENLKRKNVKLALLTLRRKKGLEKQLRDFLLMNCFDLIITRWGVDPLKEKYDGLAEILNELKIQLKEAVFVGDTDCDVKAGRRIGVITIGVLSGLSGQEILERENPDLIIKDITRLEEVLETIIND